MTMRFWISVDSLKRPPTLLTIPSSFSSSSIAFTPLKRFLDQLAQVGDATVEVVVKYLVLIFSASLQFLAGVQQPVLDHFLALRSPTTKALLQHFQRRGPQEDRHAIG